MSTSTYFVQDSVTGAVKIDISVSVSSRVAALQTCNPHKLNLLGIVQRNIERELHSQFKDIRLNGEWFKGEPELLRWLKENLELNKAAAAEIDAQIRKIRDGRLQRLRPQQEAQAFSELEVLCDRIFAISQHDPEEAALDIVGYCAPDDLYACFSDPELGDEFCYDVWGYACEWHTWEDSINAIVESGHARKIGVNERERLIYVVLNPVNSDDYRYWLIDELPDIGMELDNLAWTLEVSLFDPVAGICRDRLNCAALWVERLVEQRRPDLAPFDRQVLTGYIIERLGIPVHVPEEKRSRPHIRPANAAQLALFCTARQSDV